MGEDRLRVAVFGERMIVFTDIESTGLDPVTGHLLEVALVVVDDNLIERGHTSIVVRPVGIDIGDVQMPLFVREMHEKSGLLADIPIIGVRRHEAEAILIEWLTTTFGRIEDLRQIPLAGSTVGFDRRWLLQHMATLQALFSYRSVDVSALTELANRWAPSVYANRPKQEKGIPHRALEDARNSVEYLRYYRSSFLKGE